MSFGKINYCDFCGEMIFPEDVAPVKIEEGGHIRQHHFHNRHPEDCLGQQLAILDKELAHAA
jgi:hypothetical protein